jgi:hypothetical protein
MLQDESLAKIQVRLDIGETDRLEKEFLASAEEKFPLRKDSRSATLFWWHETPIQPKVCHQKGPY